MKTKMRYHYTPIKIADIKNGDGTKGWQVCGNVDLSYAAARNVKWYI